MREPMTNLRTLKDRLKTEAEGLGFTHIGIAAAQPAPHFESYLAWLDAGYHAGMGYLSRQDTVTKRGDPQLILEDCQRVICLALPYHLPETSLGKPEKGLGRISSYALTKDYHDIILDKLAHLEAFIQKNTENKISLRSYVDTGPILERSFASKAGIGIAGKNTCLLIQGAGSYFFLAEILTDLPLPVDEPFSRDLCGSCTRCIDACPTSCILSDRTLDANRCISYLTIENKDIIPDNLKSGIGNWLFGCDVCQMVCPHNAREHEQALSLGEPKLPELPKLIPLFDLNDESFTIQFGDTPLSRARRKGILRNAAIVLGNQREREALPALRNALAQEDDPVILDACRWAVNQIEQHPPS